MPRSPLSRRHFTRNFALGFAALALPGTVFSAESAAPQARIHVPPRLRRGDTVSLVTPGSFISDDSLQTAYTNLESLGYVVKPGTNLRRRRGYTAGTIQERLDDLHTAFADPESRAVWCARGGYGAAQFMPVLDMKLIRRANKIFIGYSDITVLLNGIHDATGLVTYHGPVGSSTLTEYTATQLKLALETDLPLDILPLVPGEKETDGGFFQESLAAGRATGKLLGGNLTLLSAAVGTPYFPKVKGSLLFLEDIEERPYRIDRMLLQMSQAGVFERVAGVVLGTFIGCSAEEDDLGSLTLPETMRDRLGTLGVPVFYGLPVGHIDDMCTLPIGQPASFDGVSGRLSVRREG